MGFILTQYDGGMITYRGFGTFENPCRVLQTIKMQHNPLLDGNFSIDAIMNPKSMFGDFSSVSFAIVDFSKQADKLGT